MKRAVEGTLCVDSVIPEKACCDTHERYTNLMRELHKEDPELLRNFLCVDKDLFKDIIKQVEPLIQKREDLCV